MSSENIYIDGQLCAVIISLDSKIAKTEFFTNNDSILQVGQIALSRERPIMPHIHLPVERRTVGTNEVLVILKGSIEMHLYGQENTVQVTRELFEGQAVLLVGGGHAFETKSDCQVLEVKNGPFVELGDKEYLK